MKKFLASAVLMTTAVSFAACQNEPLQRTEAPLPDDQGAYRPMPMQKPLPPEGYIPGQPMPDPNQPQPPMQSGIRNEEAFLQAYANKRSPRIMVFVNRTIVGDPLPKDGLQEIARTDVTHKTAGPGGNTAAAKSVSVKKAVEAYDSIGASADDYEMIEASLVKYFNDSGRVQIQDSDAARAKMDRAQVLRLENGDPAAARLLGVELKQDILIRVTAKPTRHSSGGPAVRLIAKAVGTADARNLGTAMVDMPLPMSKTNINVFTRYIAEGLMGDMAKKWLIDPQYDPVEIRIYKTASVDDALRIKKWLLATRNVQGVNTRAATGGSETSYASFMVAYRGAPEDLYADLKDAIGASQGLKAVDVQNTTIDLEVTGKLDLVTTTRKSETITTTTTTEEKTVEPINPAPAPGLTPLPGLAPMPPQ
jgi:hypothetical protein